MRRSEASRTTRSPAACLAGVSMALGVGAVAACGAGDDEAPACVAESAIALPGDSCLVFVGRPLKDEATIAATVGEAFEAIRGALPVTGAEIQVRADPSAVIRAVGVGGFNPSPTLVQIALDPSRPDYRRAIRVALPPILAHELHHLMRRRSVGYGSTLLEATITEGLADHFSLEVFGGPPPPWSTALEGAQLTAFVDRVLTTGTRGGYDHDQWFFGTTADIPHWTGYAVGFELVQRYRVDNGDSLPSALVDVPAPRLAGLAP